MSDDRGHPFDVVFGSIGAERFTAISDEIAPEADIEAFLAARPAIELLHELRPDDGLGDSIDDFVAFVHAAWAYWANGQRTLRFGIDATRRLCDPVSFPATARDEASVPTMYIQLAPRRIWAQLVDDAGYEPLDGCFVMPSPDGVRVVACFGVHARRPGLSVVTAEGKRPSDFARGDGTPLFSPLMPGGESAGLYALSGPEEFLLLVWRAVDAMEDGEWQR